jgi:hypothetical protein
MNKKELITPFLVAALSLLFVAICFMVFLSNGKSKKWVARKMKIGGIILSLSAISMGTGCTRCYDEPSPDYIKINGFNTYYVEIDLDTGNTLYGNITMPDIKTFSFSINDTTILKQKGELIPIDGEFGDKTEEFKFDIDNSLEIGNYQLKFFDCTIDEQDTKYPIQQFDLIIKNE